MSFRKKPGVVFCAIVIAVVLLVGYPLSFGPACWVMANAGYSSTEAFGVCYWPIGWCAEHGPSTVRDLVKGYATIGLPPAARIELPTNSSRDCGLFISKSGVGRFVY